MSQLYFPSLSPENMTSDGPSTTAELQGALCGLLCHNNQANRTTWYTTLFEDYKPGPEELQNLIALFEKHFDFLLINIALNCVMHDSAVQVLS